MPAAFARKPRATSALILALAALFISAGKAQAQVVLWDQSAHTSTNVTNQVFPDIPTYSNYTVSDVTFSSDVTITEITTYNFPFGSNPGSTLPVALTLFSKTATVPGGGDTPGNLGSFTAAYTVTDPVNNEATIDLSGLNLSVTAGDYWIGISPIVAFGNGGQTFQYQSSTTVGDQSAIINPGGGFGFGTVWSPMSGWGYYTGDSAILIKGNVQGTPEPGSLAMFVGFGLTGVTVLRRRRATQIGN